MSRAKAYDKEAPRGYGITLCLMQLCYIIMSQNIVRCSMRWCCVYVCGVHSLMHVLRGGGGVDK